MLPSKGYFNSFDCPYYLSSTNCQKPYCHFKHSKREPKQALSEGKIANIDEEKIDWKALISSAPAPETPVVVPVKHIPITFIPTKPSAISVNTKKPKNVQSPYVPTAKNDVFGKKNNTFGSSNPFSSFDYDPSSFIDSSEKTYSRYSYEKGHDSGDEIMENHKSIIETNHLKLDEGSKSGYDEEMDDFDGEAQFSPDISLKEEDDEASLKEVEIKPIHESKVDVSAFGDIKLKPSKTSTGLDETTKLEMKNTSKREKCKKKRKYSDLNEASYPVDGDKKENSKNCIEKLKEKTEKPLIQSSTQINSIDLNNSSKNISSDRSKSTSPKRIKIEKNASDSTENDVKIPIKKVCKKDKKRLKHLMAENHLYEDKNDSKDIIVEVKKHVEDSKKHSSSNDGKKRTSDKKNSEKKDEIKQSNKSHSSEQKKNTDSNKKRESKDSESENKHSEHRKHSSNSKKHLSDGKTHHKDSTSAGNLERGSSVESKKHSESKKKSSPENKTHLDKDVIKKHISEDIGLEKDSSNKNHLSKDKSHSLHKSKRSSSEKHNHSSSHNKKHSSSNHKKEKSDNEKISSSSDRNKKHSSKSSTSSKTSSNEKRHSDESKKQIDKKNQEKHSANKEMSRHKIEEGKIKSRKTSVDSKSEERHKSKEKLKRKYSDSSDSVISTDEKKETILISDSSENEEESNRESNSPRIEDILGLGDDSDEPSNSSDTENENEYKPMHVGGFKGTSPAYKPSPISSTRRHEDQLDIDKNFIQVSTSSDEHYTKPVTAFKVRIAHVPNVSSLLSAKTLINSAKIVPPALQKIVTATRIINPSANSTKAIATPSTSQPRPHVNADLESVVAVNIRQPGLNNIFDELMKFVDYDDAYKRSVEEETEICNVATNPQSYRNRVALCILRIRKSKGAVDIVKKDKVTSDSIPDYTYGQTLYECFSKYLLKPEEYVLHGYPLELPGRPGCVYIDKSSFFRNKHTGPIEGPFRKCINCGQEYAVDEETGMPLTKNDCHHHWGKPIGNRQGKFYTCCKSEVGSDPCHISLYHVTELKRDDCLSGYVRSRPYPDNADPNKAGIYAMDCEMCFTTQGRDIVRASLLAVDNESVYDVLIKPKHPILDYCTRFSGITEEKLANVTTTLEDVQQFLLKTIYDKTILVGHSLENDLKALKLIHYNVVDTSIMYPHKEGLPVKCALRTLCSRILGTAIQTGEHGHDSLEDSRASLQLVIHQVKEDAKIRKPRVVKQLKSAK